MSRDGITLRLHKGGESQEPDPFIAAKMGAANTPAYRGTAYVVFEELPLERFGNRLPQLSFEVFRPILDGESAESLVRAVTLIPASGEFAYATDIVRREGGDGETSAENVNAEPDAADLSVALDRLEACAPKVESVSLVVAWFGDDLRAGHCRIRPGVEVSAKIDDAGELVGRRRRPRRRASRQPRRPGPPGLRRHAVRQRRGAGDPRAEGPRLPGHLLPVHPDGRGAGQRAAGPLQRPRRRHRPAGLSLARADHLLAGRRLRRQPGQERRRRQRRSPPSSATPSRRTSTSTTSGSSGTAIPTTGACGG